ncbi:low-density lipoprotein receptor-related protein 6-like [Oppia nitens]|uniref:low-density lipoprotein receptor-related protein 6-like n=1 Tax=Oppia nitens TaxID=1686743 RepID=UPI0023DAF625|nr:low-density lipoprotein receptor-related protein 6-like [Oppia nitens]
MTDQRDNDCICLKYKCHKSSSIGLTTDYIHIKCIYLLVILCIHITITSGVSRPTYLLFANRKDIRLLNSDNQRPNASVIMNHLEEAAALDYYFKDSIIFWADIGLEMIKGIKINGSLSQDKAFTIIQSGIVSPDGLACDWLTKKLYWTDSETNRIEVSDFDGVNRKVLFWKDLDQPRAIALSPKDGLMFWTDWGEMPKIERSSMDGESITRTVLVKDNILWPNGLTIDYEAKRVYWAEAKFNFISSMDFSGSNQKVVVSDNMPHPFAITMIHDIIYWTDWTTKAIHSFNKNTRQRRRIISGQLSPMGIHVYSSQRQLPSETPCDQENGGCSHLCLLSSISPFYSCGCPTGVQLLSDLKTCATGPQEILFLARRVDIRRISLDTPDFTDVILPLRHIKHAIAVDFDPVDKMIYWTDDEVHVIRRAYLNGSHQEDIVATEVHHPDGIAIDWIAHNIYWTDTGTDRIEVARLNGTFRKILLTEGLEEPRAIVVHPIEGFIFWSDWGTKPKIERAALDGTQRSVIINRDLVWPNGLAIDYDLSKIYWSDAKTDKIEKSNFDGSERKIIVSDQIPHVFGFTLLNDYVYWSDWQKRSIERVHKITGQQREIIVDQLPDLMGLKAVAVNRIIGTNPCAVNNGNCSHLCLYRPKQNYVCACPMGYELSTDMQTCIVPEAFLLFSRKTDIHRISLASHHLDIIPIAGVQETTSFDYHLNDNRIYWTDVKLKTINRSFMNGSNIEHIIEYGLEYPQSLAVDWVANNVYWTDTEFNRIEVSRLDGHYRKILIWKDLENPRSIALSPGEGLMFWSDWSPIARIERSALDGTQRHVIANNIGKANSLTIDYSEHRLYWIDIESHKIMSSSLDGNNRNVILKESLRQPYTLTVYQNYVYWADWETNTIEKAIKSNGLNRTQIQTQLDYVIDLMVYHNSRQSGWNPCAVNNGGCDHLCLALPGNNQRANTHRCLCSSHYILNDDNKTCSAPQSFLLYSQRNAITRLVMDTIIDAPDITLPIHNLKNIKAITYDSYENVVIWIDSRTSAIKRANINGTGMGVILPASQDTNQPFDIEVDPYSRVIYWSCSHSNSINATRLDGTNIGAIVSDQLNRPRTLSLHYKKRFLFWVNDISPPKIERLSILGLIGTTIAESKLDEVSALTVDVDLDLIYWAESSRQIIECSTLDGDNRHTISQSSIMHPISMVVFDNYLYLIEREQKVIERIHKLAESGKETVYSRIPNLTDIISVTKINTNVVSCLTDNGGCSHLCIILHTDGTHKCSCPNGMILSNDEHTCITPPHCSSDQFACLTGNVHCIPINWRCDGNPECQDKSDELNCPKCLENQFTCVTKSGDKYKTQCMDNTLLCDSVADCMDGFDEQCCGWDHFKCKSGRNCVNIYQVCDQKNDCSDGSDESQLSCRHKMDRMPLEMNTSHNHQKPMYILVVLISLFVFVVLFLLMCRCRKKNQTYDEKDYGANDMLMSPQRPLTSQSNDIRTNTLLSGSENTLGKRMTINGNFGICPTLQQCGDTLYERNITGASSTSSSIQNYPKETLNPPPSPVTDQSQCNFDGSSSSSIAHSRSSKYAILQHRSKKNRWINRSRGPPPTPCSTDVYEDSDTAIKYTAYYDNTQAELGYDSDPYPPPPTPRSHYLSDLSGPPSPVTERSYSNNPYPPPPSPVPELDTSEIT